MPQHTAGTILPARGKGAITRIPAAFWLVLLAFLLLLAAPAQAKKADKSQLDGNWGKTLALLTQTKDPLAQKLLVWLYASESTMASEPRGLRKFEENNP